MPKDQETAQHQTALWWARIRAAGPQLVAAGTPAPPGLLRLPEPGGTRVWLTTDIPNAGGPATLDELDLPRPVLEMPNDTARVLAACVRCCWSDPAGPLWPGATVPSRLVVSVFGAMTGRDGIVAHRAVVGALRRLSWSGWLLWDTTARTVRLGPRVAAWNQAELSTLRELWRSMPAPGPLPAGQDDVTAAEAEADVPEAAGDGEEDAG